MEIVVKTSKRQNIGQRNTLFTDNLRERFNAGETLISELNIFYMSESHFYRFDAQTALTILTIAEKYEIEEELEVNFQYSVLHGLKLGHHMKDIKNNITEIESKFKEYWDEQVIDEISIVL